MPPTALHTTRRSSDLSKHSAEVFAEAEDHPVTVTRRDGEALVLMSQREADSRSRMLQFAAQLISVVVDDKGPLAERMSRAFPWMLALTPVDRASCAQDLVDAARASFSTDQPHLVLAALNSWKETATAIAAGLGRGEPTEEEREGRDTKAARTGNSLDYAAGIAVSDYPQLQLLAWNLKKDAVISPEEALSLYERNWRHVDTAALTGSERELIDTLVGTVGKGSLLV